MKIKENVKKYLAFALLVLAAFLGAQVFSIINLASPIIVSGFIGSIILYYLITVGLMPENTEPFKSPFKPLKDIRFWLKIFVGGGVFYWALQQVFIMISEVFIAG